MPPDVISKAHSLEMAKDRILAALDRPGVDQTLEVREAYKKIADTIWEARNITDESMEAIEASGGEGVSASSIEASLADIMKRHDQATVSPCRNINFIRITSFFRLR